MYEYSLIFIIITREKKIESWYDKEYEFFSIKGKKKKKKKVMILRLDPLLNKMG